MRKGQNNVLLWKMSDKDVVISDSVELLNMAEKEILKMNDAKCPHCGHDTLSEPLSTWIHGHQDVSHHRCPECKKTYRVYRRLGKVTNILPKPKYPR